MLKLYFQREKGLNLSDAVCNNILVLKSVSSTCASRLTSFRNGKRSHFKFEGVPLLSDTRYSAKGTKGRWRYKL